MSNEFAVQAQSRLSELRQELREHRFEDARFLASQLNGNDFPADQRARLYTLVTVAAYATGHQKDGNQALSRGLSQANWSDTRYLSLLDDAINYHRDMLERVVLTRAYHQACLEVLISARRTRQAAIS